MGKYAHIMTFLSEFASFVKSSKTTAASLRDYEIRVGSHNHDIDIIKHINNEAMK